MSRSRVNLCQAVPARAPSPQPSRRVPEVALSALLAAFSCAPEASAPLPLPEQPEERAAPAKAPAPTAASPSPAAPPRFCPAIACVPHTFEVRLERSIPWAPGTYYIRASVDGGPRRVCSVVLEPVLGAAHDTCGGPDIPFRVHYRYDETEQTISSVSFSQVSAVQLTVLTSEEAPPLVQIEHRLQFRSAAVADGCAPCPPSPLPVSVRVREPREYADAGSEDAGPADRDAGARGLDAATVIDAGTVIDAASELPP